MIREVLGMLVEGKNLTKAQAKDVMKEIMQGRVTSAQIAAFLVALRIKKETVDEIVGLSEEMISKAVSFPWDGDVLVDTCGTGGDNLGTFNVSTTCIFVIAAAGIKVAKHGNRALSSRCGSADVLEELGVKIDLPCHLVKKALEEVGIGFLYAPFFHQAMKHALPVRRQIGVRTVFNLLGPLTNPLRANIRLMGVYDCSLISTMAELGINKWPLKEIKGGDRKINAMIIRDILSGREKGAKRDMTLINSAFCLIGAGVANSLREGVMIASDCIDSGDALKKLNQLVEFTNSFSSP